MVHKTFYTVLSVVFALFFFFILSARIEAMEPSPQPSAPAITAPHAVKGPSPVVQLNAVIETVHLKDNKVFIILRKTGPIAREDFSHIMLRMETSRGHRQWNLHEVVDRSKSLSAGRVEFDTGIGIDKTETVKATLLIGSLQKPEVAVLTPVMAAAAAAKPPTADPMQAAASASTVRPAPSPRKAVPLMVDRGIRMSNPTSQDVYYQGETVYIMYQMTTAADPQGSITFSMIGHGMGNQVATMTVPAARSGVAAISMPETTPLSRYYITGFNPISNAYGESDVFEVAANSGAIAFRAPSEGEMHHPGEDMLVRYQLPHRVEAGTIRFELMQGTTPVSYQTQEYLPGSPADHSPPVHTIHLRVPHGLASGNYRISATHPKARGNSPVFAIGPIPDGSGWTTVDCDYGIRSVTFSNGSSLDTGFTPGSGATAHGIFRLNIHWNGVPIPSTYPPGTEFVYQLHVYSKITGERLCSYGAAHFHYTTQENFTMDLPFYFAKDSIPRLSRGRVIPLEFRLEKISPAIDVDSSNNNLSADMRMLNALENNMEIEISSGDFSLSRRPHAGPLDEYHFSQRFRVRNLSRNEAGGPPAPMTVTVKGCLDSREAGESWRTDGYCINGSKTVSVANVGADWVSGTLTHTAYQPSPRDIPYNRRYRLKLEADPDRELIDTNRHNNIGQIIFRITEAAAGAGSGEVVPD